jgi:DNA recombination protein RmuC
MSNLLLALLTIAALAAVAWYAIRRERQLARTQADLDLTRRALDEQKTALTESKTQLREMVGALSRDALKENRQDFLTSADALLKPMRDTLERVQVQLTAVDKEREGTYRAVASQLGSLAQAQEQLRQTTEGLSKSLRSPNIRGKWGEVQLRRIVELAGMLQQCDFFEKESSKTQDGARQTPDMIVRLPGQTSIVIDSKVPIDAYVDAGQAKDDARRDTLLALHARQVREHIKALGAKDYSRQFQPGPEFVVMFLPLESLWSTAFEQDAKLFDLSASLNVIPATPMTLLVLLRTVAQAWQQQALTENAEEIRVVGRELYERLATMVNHLEKLGGSLKQSADHYDRFIGSLEQNVVPGARKLKELGVSSNKELEMPEALHLTVRRIKKTDLMRPGDDVGVSHPLLEVAGPTHDD